MIVARPGDTALDMLLRTLPNLWVGLGAVLLAGGILTLLIPSWETKQWIEEAILDPLGVVWALLFIPAMTALHFLRERRIRRGAPPP
jgi:hypothetical protein